MGEMKSKFEVVKDKMNSLDYSCFTSITDVVSYQMDIQKMDELEKMYGDPNVISMLPEFQSLEEKYSAY